MARASRRALGSLEKGIGEARGGRVIETPRLEEPDCCDAGAGVVEGDEGLGRLFRLSVLASRTAHQTVKEINLPGVMTSGAFLRAMSTPRCSIAPSIALQVDKYKY